MSTYGPSCTVVGFVTVLVELNWVWSCSCLSGLVTLDTRGDLTCGTRQGKNDPQNKNFTCKSFCSLNGLGVGIDEHCISYGREGAGMC